MKGKHRAALGATIVALTALASAVQAATAARVPVLYAGSLAGGVLARPQPVRVRPPMPGSAAGYTVVDHGAPPSSLVLYNAASFNNTGQIVGLGADSALKGYDGNSCLLFDGSAYRDVGTLPSLTNCLPNGINDVNPASGTLAVVGYGNTVTTEPGYTESKALYISLAPTAKLFRTAVYTNDQGSLVGVNAAGTAVGSADYNPLAGFITAMPPFVVAAGRGSLQLLQPGCTLARAGCGAVPNYEDEQVPCGFGGCRITNDGSLLLYDLFSGSYEIVEASGVARDIGLAADVASVPIMNNAEQVVYAAESVVAGMTVVRTQLYAAATGKITTVPSLSGMQCSQYVPLSINNSGAVLGYASDCGTNYGSTYFTYDPAHGTVALPATLPGGYFAYVPHAINDEDQILVDLELTSGGPFHWGLLQPSKAAFASALRSPNSKTSARAIETSTPEGSLNAAYRARSTRTTRVARSQFEPQARPAIDLRRLPRASGPTYRLVDDGAPPVSAYTLESPVAFNNDGQIVGTANFVPYRNNTACFIFDGSAFRNLNDLAVVNCTPFALSDENVATGTANVVGSSTSAFDAPSDTKAFVSLVTASSGTVRTRRFAGNDGSALVAVNVAGEALGQGDYAPIFNQTVSFGLFELAPGSNTLGNVEGCMSSYSCAPGYIQLQACAFGGCYITADGTLFLTNELIAPNGTSRPVRLDINANRPIINNNGQILYRDGANTELYALSTGKATLIPRLPGAFYSVPLSFNNEGHVLGYFAYDYSQPETYFIYDAVHGTRSLSALLPAANAAVVPVAINDKDQILVQLTLPSGVNHWGILTPPAATSAKRR